MSPEQLGFALRPGVFTLQEISESASALDQAARVSRIFIPDGRSGYESLEIASSILVATNRIRAGSGVIRLMEHDPLLLVRRIQTIQAFSHNRFLLGVGTGSPGPHPGRSVVTMLQRLDELKKGFQTFPEGVRPPETFVATLKSGIARRSVDKTDGLLVNFCSPQHAASITTALQQQGTKQREIACYLKIFYASKDDASAKRLMLQEFLNYDSSPQYHKMFLQDGTADAIRSLKEDEDWRATSVKVPEPLYRVSLANPQAAELHRYVQSFRKAGVTLPVIYPYFPFDEKSGFKHETTTSILNSV